MEGWIKLHRKIANKAFYKNDSEMVHLWVHILISASHEPREEYLGGKPIICQPGQFTTGRRQLAEATGIHESKIQRILEKLSKIEQQIEQQTTSINRLITVLNWHEYQEGEQRFEQRSNNERATSERSNNERTTSEQQNGHLNHLKISDKEGISEQQMNNDRTTTEQQNSPVNNLKISDKEGISEQQVNTLKERLIYKDYYKEDKEYYIEEDKEKIKKENSLFENEKNFSQESEPNTLTTEKETPPPVATAPSPSPKPKKPQPVELSFPFIGEAFMQAWNLWMTQPKQKKKPMSAHQLTLNRLAKFNEEFATGLVEIAASNGYQGCIFPNTAEDYRNFIANKGQKFNKRMSFNDYIKLSNNDQSPAF